MSEHETVVFLPGLICDEALFQFQVQDLKSQVKCQVILLDFAQTIKDLALGVLEKSPETFSLVGASMGGYVAFEILRLAPERVKRLALINTQAGLDSPEVYRQRFILIEHVGAHKDHFHGISQSSLSRFIHESQLQDQALAEIIMGMGKRLGADAYIRQQKAILGRTSSVETLKDITCPTLIIAGCEDQVTPMFKSEIMNKEIRGSRFIALERCGHLANLEKPESVTEHLKEWLEWQ